MAGTRLRKAARRWPALRGYRLIRTNRVVTVALKPRCQKVGRPRVLSCMVHAPTNALRAASDPCSISAPSSRAGAIRDAFARTGAVYQRATGQAERHVRLT